MRKTSGKSSTGNGDPLRRAELAKIHIARKELGLDDNCYDALIQGVGGAASGSAKDLDARGRDRVLARLKELGFKEKTSRRPTAGPIPGAPAVGRSVAMKYQDLDSRDGDMASGKQLRYIEALWNEVSFKTTEVEKKEALKKFMRKLTKKGDFPGVDDLRFVTSKQAHRIITAMKRIAESNLKYLSFKVMKSL